MVDIPSTNEIQVFQEDLAENMMFLAANIPLLEEREQDFASSLCEQYMSNGRLSMKQLPYALKFWREARDNKDIKDGKIIRFDGNRKTTRWSK